MTGSLSPYILHIGSTVGALAVLLLGHVLIRRWSLKTLFVQEPWFDGPSRSFYGLLDVAVRDHFSLFRNVAFDDVVRYSGPINPLPRAVKNSFFDILLCDRRNMVPQCGIIHVKKGKAESRKTRRLRKFCDRANLPLLVYETGRMLDVSRLRNDVYMATGFDKLESCEVLGDARGVEDGQGAQAINSEEGTRSCNKCGGEMALRTIAKGQFTGQKAWICGKYPECRHAILVKNQVEV